MLTGISQSKAETVDTVSAFLYNAKQIDLCGSTDQRQSILVLSIGKVEKKDSLFGFNFEINYDTTKMKYHSALYMNTLSEFFDFKQVGFSKDGKITGTAASGFTAPQVYGDRPLIAFLGDYLDNCYGEVSASISYVEFTDEYHKVLNETKPYSFKVERINNPARYFKLKSDKDTVTIDENSDIVEILIKSEVNPDSNNSSLKLKIETDEKSNISLQEITESVSSVKISNITGNDFSKNIDLNILGTIDKNEILKLKVGRKDKNKGTAAILLKTVSIDTCSCITKFTDKTVYVNVEKKKDTTTSVQEISDKGIKYLINSDILEFTGNDDIREITIYDLIGNKLKRINANENDKITIVSLKEFTDNMYFIKAVSLNRFTNKEENNNIILIKN